MDFKRKINKKSETELSRTLRGVRSKHSKSLMLVGVVGCLLAVAGLWFGTEYMSDPEVDETFMLDASPYVRKHVVVAEDSASGFLNDTSQGNDTNSGTVATVNTGNIGSYDIRYYVMFPLYEATLTQINGDWDDDGVMNGSKSDGGFGPLQETHSGLPNTIEFMYDSDPAAFDYLKPFADDASIYLKRCNGGDRRNHKWPNDAKTTGCVTYWDGSLKLKQAVEPAIAGNAIKTKQFYDYYMQANESCYIEPALNKLQEITGKSANELGYGTVACLFAVYVRYGANQWATNGCTAGMSEEDIIRTITQNAHSRASSVDKPRFVCSADVAIRMNSGEIDIYSYYTCNGSCGSSHSISAGRSFGDLFGRSNESQN